MLAATHFRIAGTQCIKVVALVVGGVDGSHELKVHICIASTGTCNERNNLIPGCSEPCLRIVYAFAPQEQQGSSGEARVERAGRVHNNVIYSHTSLVPDSLLVPERGLWGADRSSLLVAPSVCSTAMEIHGESLVWLEEAICLQPQPETNPQMPSPALNSCRTG